MYKTYHQEIWKALGYLPAWLPTDQLTLGGVGVLDNNRRFRQETTLAALSVSAAAMSSTSTAHLKYYSAGEVAVTFKAAGTPPAPNSVLSVEEAGFTIEFGHENSIMFEAVGCRHERFSNVNDIGTQILAHVDAKLWRRDFFVITEIVWADSATILISKGGQARFEASIHGIAETTRVSIGDAKLGIAVKRSTSLGVEIAAQTNLTPLYTAYRVRKNWWNNGRWEAARSFEGPLERLSADDVLTLPAST